MGSGKKVYFEGTSMVAVPFVKGRETLADTLNGPTYKRAPFKVEKSLSTPATVSTTTFDESALVPNPSNMKEYNPAAPNGSYDLTKPESKGNSSSVEFKDRDVRKGTFYKTSNGQAITLQQSHEYLERGCMSNPGIFSEVAKYSHSRQFL